MYLVRGFYDGKNPLNYVADQSIFAESSSCADQIHICQPSCRLYSQQDDGTQPYSKMQAINIKWFFVYVIRNSEKMCSFLKILNKIH
jgi:hypothetical protein